MEYLSHITLTKGYHETRGEQLCVMEAVAYIAGEPHSDHPQCACPVITEFLIGWNDSLPTDADRDRLLKPLIPLIINTRSTLAVEQKRRELCADWMLREYATAWLEAAGLTDHAETLRATPTRDACIHAREAAYAARDAARAAAGDAARAAARDAAWAATWDAARDAAWDAARAAARDAARDAAWAAARAAAWDALKPTVAKLQTSAVKLVKRMIAVTDQ